MLWPRMIETVVINARVITMGNVPNAQAFAISLGRIAAIGNTKDILKLIDSQTTIVDMQGATITPGLIDTHVHVASLGSVGAGAGLAFVGSNSALDISHASTVKDVIKLIKEKVVQSRPGDWILTCWPTSLSSNEKITRRDLDTVAPDNPVMVSGYPYIIVNSYLLNLSGIGPDTAVPPGGEIVRNIDGELTGELAFQAVYQFLPCPPQPTVEETQTAILKVQDAFLREGITSYRDVGLRDPAIVAYRNLRKKQQLRCRSQLTYTWLWSMDDAVKAIDYIEVTADEWIGFRSVKLSLDGGIISRTASTSDDWYLGDQKLPGAKGYFKIAPDTFVAMVDRLHRAGLQIVCHCEGDRAIDLFLHAVEKAVQATPTDNARHSVIHCNLPSDSAILRMSRLGSNIVVETQSIWLTNSSYATSCGPERSKRFMPLRTMIENKIIVGNGCDYPPHDFPPRNGVSSACSRRATSNEHGTYPYGQSECLSFEQALRTYTSDAARCLFWESDIGSLEKGKLADFVVWDRAIDLLPPADVSDAKVDKTYVGGQLAYDRSPTSRTAQ